MCYLESDPAGKKAASGSAAKAGHPATALAIVDAAGDIHGPFGWLSEASEYLRDKKLPEPFIIAQVKNGAPDPVGDVIRAALLAGMKAINLQEKKEVAHVETPDTEV